MGDMATSASSRREIAVFEPYLGDDTLGAVARAFEERWLGMGTSTKEFEELLAEFLQLEGRRVVATNTGTSALHLALLSAGAGPGVEVIVPSFNFVADHQAITATGASPVFCDIEDQTLGLDPNRVRELVREETGILLPLHFSGIPCLIDELYDIAQEQGLRVVEDATHAIGSHAGTRKIGSFGDLACFSFDPVKVITSIDGGAVVVPASEDLAALQQRRLLGIDRDTIERYANRRAWDYDVIRPGFRYHLTNVLARVGISQLARIDEFVANRQGYCRIYQSLLAGVDGIETPKSDYTGVSPFIYWIRVMDGRRDSLVEHLGERGISTGIHFMPAHSYSLYRNCLRGELPVTERVSSEIVTLPLHAIMNDGEVEYICGAIKDFAERVGSGAA
jgi:dTDP-4-amino-4,6-dideoxygalactose transaminase